MNEKDREVTIRILRHIRPLKIRKNDLEMRLEEIEFDINDNDCGGVNFGERTSHTYKISNETQDRVLSYLATSRNLRQKIKKLEIAIKRIDNALELLSPTDKIIIELRIKDTSWKEVGEEVSLQSIPNMRDRMNVALDRVGILINDIDVDYLLN